MFLFKDLVIEATTGPLIPLTLKALFSIFRKHNTETSLAGLAPIRIARLSLLLGLELGFAPTGLVVLFLAAKDSNSTIAN